MCGIVGIVGTPDASHEVFLGLTTLQHRGQDAAGILSCDSNGFHQVRDLGLVESVFTRENMKPLKGEIAIGHARYSTVGKGSREDVQPFLLSYPYGIGMVHNGNLVNWSELADDLRSRGRRLLMTHSDTEVILNRLAEGLAESPHCPGDEESQFESICNALKGILKESIGSYSVATVIAGQGLLAFRDPHGIRPLIWGSKKLDSGKTAHIVTSESVTLSFLGYQPVRDLNPGEVLFITLKGEVFVRSLDYRAMRSCMFEWVYFASPESILDNVPVYGTRIQLGKSLASLVKDRIEAGEVEADIIVPIPESSRIAAIAMAEELNIPYREVLIKNRYIKRTFILDSQDKRQSAVNLKLSPVRSEIEGKNILLVDDSIVRGTTSRKIVKLIRNAGAKKVSLVSTCPPIRHPCYYGIDFPDEAELVAAGRSHEEIQQELGVDAMIYQEIEGLQRAIQQSGTEDNRVDPCMACLNGKYPTEVGCGASFAQARKSDRQGNDI